MKQSKVFFILIAIIFLAFPQPSFAKDTKNVGKFAEVSGTVALKKSGGKKEFKAAKNMAFTQGDTISTSAKSNATLHVDSDKEVTVSANTKLVVKQLVKDINDKSHKSQFSLSGGKVKVKINKKLQGDSKFQVQTPNAIMGVMGTEFHVAYDGEHTYVGVSEGVVRVTLPNSEEGATQQVETYDLYPQQFIDIDGNGSATIRPFGDTEMQFFDTASDLSQLPVGNTTQLGESGQTIQYDPIVANSDDDDDDDDNSSSSGGGSSGGSSDNDGGDSVPPTNPDDSEDTTDPIDPDIPTDPGDITDPEDTTDPETPTDPNPPPTKYEQGFTAGVLAKTEELLEKSFSNGLTSALDELLQQNDPASEYYQQGFGEGEMDALIYSGDPLPSYTEGYNSAYNERYSAGYGDGYLDGSADTHGFVVMPPMSDYEHGYIEGMASIDERAFESTAEALAKYEEGKADRFAQLSALTLDEAQLLGKEEGLKSGLYAIGFEAGHNGDAYDLGYNAGYIDGGNSTP